MRALRAITALRSVRALGFIRFIRSARAVAFLATTLTATLALVAPSAAGLNGTPAAGQDGYGSTSSPHTTPADAPVASQQILFKASQDPGYACFRIPAIVKTNAGTLLAFSEGRVNDCGDAGDIDIVVKRSTDGGHTWSNLSVVNQGDGDTHGNPAPIVDRRTGRILLAETYNPGRTDGKSCQVPCDRTPHMQYSDDDGQTWSTPRDLSDEILPADWNSWYATGPVHGIQLTKGRHEGRLVFAVNTETWDGTRVSANHAALIISDDGGDHWRIGAHDSWPIAQDGTFRQKPSEMSVTELADGALYVSGREQDGTDLGHRTENVSRDSGDSFIAPFHDLPDLYAPQVQGSILNLGHNHLLMSVPADPDRRRTMMIRSSYDGGRTWEGVDRGTVVTTDWSGYSDMVRADDEVVGLMYEGGAVDARDEIRFALFTQDSLVQPHLIYPTTANDADHQPSANVLGGAQTTRGVFGDALSFDGTDDAVRLPFDDTLRLNSRDFTVSLWFRYTATTGEQPLLWMGGVGTTQPQVWMRGEPDSHRINALITTRNGASPPTSASVHTTSAYNDGLWHHLTLRRGGGKLTLVVDLTAFTANDVPGSVSRNSPFGVHLGQRMDSREFFTGALDDVRVWADGLSDDALAELGTAPGAGAEPAEQGHRGSWWDHEQVLSLPLDDIHGSHR